MDAERAARERRAGLAKVPACVPWFAALRIAWNFVQAKLHRAYPCRRCGYRYDCPDGECHS